MSSFVESTAQHERLLTRANSRVNFIHQSENYFLPGRRNLIMKAINIRQTAPGEFSMKLTFEDKHLFWMLLTVCTSIFAVKADLPQTQIIHVVLFIVYR